MSLPTKGKGPALLFRRSTLRAVHDHLAKGTSAQTTNYRISHLKGFGRWLVKDRRIGESPVAHLEGNNVEVN